MKLKNILTFSLMAMVLLAFNSCKKETVDVTDLLKSVPSSAGSVVVINIEGLLEDTGCKIKDHVVEPSKEIKDLITRTTTTNQKDFMMLFDGSTGIEPKGAVIFSDANRSFLTFALYDVDKFCSFVEKNVGGSFSEEGSGVRVCGRIAVKGAQAWICLPVGKNLDPDGIAAYSSLAASQSFLVTPMGEELLTDESDFRGWSMLDAYFNQMLNRQNRTIMSLGLGFLFDKPESIKFKADFKKGEFEAEAMVLNDKGKPAKFQLPMEKIDVNTLKSLGGTCQGMMAFYLSPKMVKKFEELGNSFGGALFGDVTGVLKNVDGTVGIVASGEDLENESVNGVLTTKGDVSMDLKEFISQNLGSISMDGKFLRFGKGTVQGNLSTDEAAEALKGSIFGVVVDTEQLANIGFPVVSAKGFKWVELKMSPESGSIELEVEAKTVNEKENALLVFLRDM
ncbi:MAG: hypothetical protein J1F43_00370 [Muribaculaceae bacterium]|nr:hypothetical protein [Muribaculaceae bacterium]